MKTKIQTFVYSLFLLSVAQLSYAQTPAAPGATAGSVESQITMTRDYTQSLLSRVQGAPANRFNVSTDYATQGPLIKAKIEAALTEFRSAMDNLMFSPFLESIAIYNDLYRDLKLPDPDKKSQLAIQRQLIEQQALNVGVVFRNEINRLFSILPELTIKEFETGRKAEYYVVFVDQSKSVVGDLSRYGNGREYARDAVASLNSRFLNCTGDNCISSDDWKSLQSVYMKQFDRYLKSICQTRTCASGILQQLASYILFVNQYLFRDLQITLADGTIVTIDSFKRQNYSSPIHLFFETVTKFNFDQSYTQLPQKN